MTAPAVLTVEQLEELAKLTAASVRPNGHVDLCYCNGCKRANAASEKLVEKLDPSLPALLDMARQHIRLTSAMEALAHVMPSVNLSVLRLGGMGESMKVTPENVLKLAREIHWKDPQ